MSRTRQALLTTAMMCFALSACEVSFGDESKPDCGPPPTGVHTAEEEPPLCQGATLRPLGVPSGADFNEVISMVEGYTTKLPVDVDRIVVGMNNVCVSLAGDASVTEIAPAAREWFGAKSDALSLVNARAVVELVDSQDWCAH